LAIHVNEARSLDGDVGKYRWNWGYKARELFSNAVSAVNEARSLGEKGR